MPLSQIQLSSSTGRRNMIINGDMRIAQRATSGTPIDTYVSLDRFRGRTYGGSGRRIKQKSKVNISFCY